MNKEKHHGSNGSKQKMSQIKKMLAYILNPIAELSRLGNFSRLFQIILWWSVYLNIQIAIYINPTTTTPDL